MLKNQKSLREPPAMNSESNIISVRRYANDKYSDTEDRVAKEIPVSLAYNGIAYTVMMCTPDDLEDFAKGFSLSEGIISSCDDIFSIDSSVKSLRYTSSIELDIQITARCEQSLKKRRRNLVGRSGCGLCGTESLEQALPQIRTVDAQEMPSSEAIERSLTQLNTMQKRHEISGAEHGVAWCKIDGNIASVREDIGRHNALDKLIGHLASTEKNTTADSNFVLISSRASYEMILKASFANIATVVSTSAPTELACTVAKRAGINLIGFARNKQHTVYNMASAAINTV